MNDEADGSEQPRQERDVSEGSKRLRRLDWATSQQVGSITELAVLSPIRKGLVRGERRTYEERLRASIANLASRHNQGIPTELDRISTIHFGRMIIIRPSQYLLLSDLHDIGYITDADTEAGAGRTARGVGKRESGPSRIPEPIDDFHEVDEASRQVRSSSAGGPSELRSWLLTLVEFDGDLKAYMREIAGFIGHEFDRIYENCEFYPGSGDFDRFWTWIRTFQIATDLFYASYRHLSVVRIRQLEAFKRRFDAFVAQVRSPTGPKVRSMDELFDGFLRENQQYASGFPTPGGLYASDAN